MMSSSAALPAVLQRLLPPEQAQSAIGAQESSVDKSSTLHGCDAGKGVVDGQRRRQSKAVRRRKRWCSHPNEPPVCGASASCIDHEIWLLGVGRAFSSDQFELVGFTPSGGLRHQLRQGRVQLLTAREHQDYGHCARMPKIHGDCAKCQAG